MKLFEQPRGPETPGQFVKRYAKVILFSCGVVFIIPACVFIFLFFENRDYDTAIANARENFPAIQAELEDGIEQLWPLLEGREEQGSWNIALLGLYYIKKDRKECVDEYGEEVVEIAERFLEIGNIYSVEYYGDSDNFVLNLKAGGTGYVQYIYQTNNPGDYKEQLAENWYLNYGPYV